MVTRDLLRSAALSSALVLVPALARAESPTAPPSPASAPPPAATPRPSLHHAPPSIARSGEPLAIDATIDHPELVRRAVLVYRGKSGFHEVPFQRAATGPYVAVIPADDVAPPSVAYTIELETLDGARHAVFATRDDLFVVETPEDLMDAREKATLARLGGRRSVVSGSGEYVDFGHTQALVKDASSSPATPASIADRYYRIEADYTYRMLRSIAEFGIRGGVVRGTSAVPGETDRSKYDVGLNYGAPHLRVRALDWLHFEGTFLTSITEVGFSVGGGAAVLVGDPYGTKLTVGFESVQVFGTSGYSRLDLVASDRVTIAPMIEITDAPHASKTGVRLLTEVRAEIGAGFGVSARGGYQARDATSGGPTAGAALWYAF